MRGAGGAPGERRPPPPRAVVARVLPEVDAGRFPAKRVLGDVLTVTAVAFADGHDRVAAVLRHRGPGETAWREHRMAALADDRFAAAVPLERLGRHEYTVDAWVDAFASWRSSIARKADAGHDVRSELLDGAALVRAAAARADGDDAVRLAARAERLAGGTDQAERVAAALAPELAETMAAYADRSAAARYDRVLVVDVERPRAAWGAWYELFPRSASPAPGRHGTLADAARRLEYVAGMGFDVVYLPPIHPIGRTFRKGRDNAIAAGPDDPGSPWAIGGPEGGHTAVHPALGTLADFDAFVARARALGLEVALDLAFQCAPDHPWVREHPEWFRWRADGTVQYAENPPKRYQDIYPFHFDGPAWRALWEALRDVVLFWVGHGVEIFRVDNPHTKPFAFWEWLIAEVRARHPTVLFLAEAFTRPPVLEHLAKLGFSQSYTYFTWRNTRHELATYAGTLLLGEAREYLRPNFFVNTPDILHAYLQTGGRPAFQARLVLAATLAGSYGVYGPPFELAVTDAVPGTEEYRDSEKYAIRHWDVEQPTSLAPLVTLVNRIRREHPALASDAGLRFVATDNDQLIAYMRLAADGSETMLVVVNLDPHHVQSGFLDLPLADLGVAPGEAFQADDLLGGGRYLWHEGRVYVALDPAALPAHVFRIRRRVRTERDFDYYL
jgi:starch synthase (maltosyl-transferring)